jgi:hypothetical protein
MSDVSLPYNDLNKKERKKTMSTLSTNMNIPVNFETSGSNLQGNCPCWNVTASVFGMRIANVMCEGKNATEKKAISLCKEKAKTFISNFEGS